MPQLTARNSQAWKLQGGLAAQHFKQARVAAVETWLARKALMSHLNRRRGRRRGSNTRTGCGAYLLSRNTVVQQRLCINGSFYWSIFTNHITGIRTRNWRLPKVIPILQFIGFINLQELFMSSFTLNAPAGSTYSAAPSFSLLSLVAAFFTLSLREKLDPAYTGENSDAAYYGCGL